MTAPFLPFAKPCLSDETIADVVATMKSGWLTTGPKTQAFEAALQSYHGAKHVLAVNSGTAALHLALLGMGIGEGDEVITTAFTFVATTNTIALVGAKPVLVDIDESMNIDLDAVEAAITPRTKAIMPVHFAGLPVNCDKLYAIAKKHGLRVIEDAAHISGGSYQGKPIGAFGDTQILSFHPNKNMTTGEGGALLTSDDELAKKASVLRFHGIDRQVWNRFTEKGSQHYDVIAPGYKYNMMDMQAVIGLHQLQHLDDFVAARTRWANRYRQALSNVPGIKIPATPVYAHQHAWHLFMIRILPQSGMTRDAFMQAMKDRGIGTGYHYPAIHSFTYYQEIYGYCWGQFPHAEAASDQVVSLPLYPHMTESEFNRVIDAIHSVLTKADLCIPQ